MASHAAKRFLVGVALAALLGSSELAAADVEGDSYTSDAYALRATLPRGWRITESSGYPRTLLWLSRSKPRVRIAITVDPIAPDCRAGATFCKRDPVAAALTLSAHLAGAGFDVRSNGSQSRTPTIEYSIGGSHLRHSVIIVNDYVVSVVMAADSPGDLSSMTRTFDRLVQSVRPLAPSRP